MTQEQHKFMKSIPEIDFVGRLKEENENLKARGYIPTLDLLIEQIESKLRYE